ncbi:alpha/beta-hydrolase [Gonapodya prolifera JEL478]|uniref:Alpha/beta-hydrolase n=1 Tax=Gonapodya prolifera (strain JEL478) TaxID=1344416 RepID=A0A139AXK4_GONPJ|nr:alpha/beta-hydrolase [Gonapodya prolifera JEL478]|eukprot:KXS21185.1 alpha/beta-hydrolase [Gonapodya prolifera JEL478]
MQVAADLTRLSFYALYLTGAYYTVGPSKPAPRKWPLSRYLTANLVRYLLTLGQHRAPTYIRTLQESPQRNAVIDKATPADFVVTTAKIPRLGASGGVDMTDLGWSKEENDEGGDIGGEWVRRQEDVDRTDWTKKRVVLVVHGGGFTMGSGKGNRLMSVEFVQRLDAVVLAIDYRLSPEYAFPAALQDVISSYFHLLNDHHIPAGNITFAGDSAGANLIMGALYWLRDKKAAPMPACATLFSAPMDREGSTGSHFVNFATDTLPFGSFVKSTKPGHRMFVYSKDTMLTHPYVSPMSYTLTHPGSSALPALPPIMNVVGGLERYCDDGLVFGLKMGKELDELKANGLMSEEDVGKWIYTCDVFEGEFHVFQQFFPKDPKSISSYARIANFVLSQTAHCGVPSHHTDSVTQPKQGVSFFVIDHPNIVELSDVQARERVMKGFDQMADMGFAWVGGGVGSIARTVDRIG